MLEKEGGLVGWLRDPMMQRREGDDVASRGARCDADVLTFWNGRLISRNVSIAIGVERLLLLQKELVTTLIGGKYQSNTHFFNGGWRVRVRSLLQICCIQYRLQTSMLTIQYLS